MTRPIRELVEELADDGMFSLVILSKHSLVQIPDHVRAEYQNTLLLNFSHLFKPSDLIVDDKGVSQTLSFNGNWYKTFIPWIAIVCVVSGQFEHKPILTLDEEAIDLIYKIKQPDVQESSIKPANKPVKKNHLRLVV